MKFIDIGLVCSIGLAVILSAIIINKVANNKAIPLKLSVVRYVAWMSFGGFVAAAILQKLA